MVIRRQATITQGATSTEAAAEAAEGSDRRHLSTPRLVSLCRPASPPHHDHPSHRHYADLVDKPFFPGLREYMCSGPVTCMVWEGTNVVKMGRQMLGATNPQESLPGTIRGDFSIEVGRNICHGSD